MKMESIAYNGVVNTVKGRGKEHSDRQKREEQKQTLSNIFGQQNGKRRYGKHKRTDVCRRQNVPEIPIVKSHVGIYYKKLRSIGQKDHRSKNKIDHFRIFPTPHTDDKGNIYAN